MSLGREKGQAMEGLEETNTLRLTNGVLFPAGCGAMLPGGLSVPTLTLVTAQSQLISNKESLLCIGCCAHANFSQRQEKDLPRTKIWVTVSDEKTNNQSPSALNFTVIIAQNFCNAPLLTFQGIVTHFTHSSIYPRMEKLLVFKKHTA